MPIKKPAIRRDRGCVGIRDEQSEAVQALSKQLARFVERVTDARLLVEGIDRLAPLFEQLALTESLLDQIGEPVRKYFAEQISYRTFAKNLHEKFVPVLLEELEALVYALPQHDDQMEELVGSLLLLDEGLVNTSFSFNDREPGVVDSLLDDDPSEEMSEFESDTISAYFDSSCQQLRAIELITSRLVEQIRTEGLVLHSALIAVGG